MSEQDHLAGLRILENYQQNNRTREDRELITQMNRLKANDIIKGMEVDAEVKNFLSLANEEASKLDPKELGYASQLIGVARDGMQKLSPAAYEKARPMVTQLYDRFDARKQVEAEYDQRALATDWMSAFREQIQGISFPDAKFALVAKKEFNVDPVFAEKDGIRIFDRKGTQAAVDVEQTIASERAGTLAGTFDTKKAELSLAGKELERLSIATSNAKQEQLAREDAAARKVVEDDNAMAALTNDESIFPIPIAVPKSPSQRMTILGFSKGVPNEPFPLTSDGKPDYRTAGNMVEEKRLATIRAETDAKNPPKGTPEDKFTEGQTKAATFFNMMKSSADIIDGLPPDSQPGLASTAVGSIPLVGKTIARSGQSDATQRYVQASETWVRAKLRRESGAVIGVDEMKGELATFFPQVGDTAGTIAQKAALRLEAQKGLRGEAGPAIKTVGGDGGSIKVENGVLQAPSMAAAEAYLAANPNASVKMLKIGKDYFEVKKTP